MTSTHRLSVLAAAALLAGCASVSSDGLRSDVASLTASRTAGVAQAALPAMEPSARAKSQQSIDGWLAQPLTQDAAVRIALLNNPGLQARLAALGIRTGEVEERFVRGAGPGGQKINKTSSTVWLRHRPTGIDVRCQRERSQSANRELAWAELCVKLEARARAVILAGRQLREVERRRTRQKSHGQKVAMIVEKKHRARHKSRRGRVDADE